MTTAWSATELQDMNNEIALELKRLCKRDATTRQKAISEIYRLLEGADPEQIEAFLPLWVS
jgi:hypothetical protein